MSQERAPRRKPPRKREPEQEQDALRELLFAQWEQGLEFGDPFGEPGARLFPEPARPPDEERRPRRRRQAAPPPEPQPYPEDIDDEDDEPEAPRRPPPARRHTASHQAAPRARSSGEAAPRSRQTHTGMRGADTGRTRQTHTGMRSADTGRTRQTHTGMRSADTGRTRQTHTGMRSADTGRTRQTQTGIGSAETGRMRSADTGRLRQTQAGIGSAETGRMRQTQTGMRSAETGRMRQTQTGMRSAETGRMRQTQPIPVQRPYEHQHEPQDERRRWEHQFSLPSLPSDMPVIPYELLLMLAIAIVSLAIIFVLGFGKQASSVSTWVASVQTVGNALGLNMPQPAAAPVPVAANPPGDYRLRGAPSISAEQIDQILASQGSPAVGTGGAWLEYGRQYEIDPAFALAFFIHESSAGTNPNWIGMKPNGTYTHNIGNIICAGYDTCYNGFRDYPTWEAGIEDWYRLMSNEYIERRGLTTIEEMIPIYCPVSDGCLPDHYIQVVRQMVDRWKQGQLP